MAYFAELDENNIVINIISVHNNELLVDGIESEEKGIEFCNTIKPSRWVKTSFSGSIRKQYAGIGYTYLDEQDVFVAPKPYPSWLLDDNQDWQAPVSKPVGNCYWDESQLSWVEVEA